MPERKPSRKPRGRALPRSDEALEGLSEINPSDVEDARAWHRAHAPARYRTLLDAQTKEDEV